MPDPTPSTCQHCSKPLPPNPTSNTCPACLLADAFNPLDSLDDSLSSPHDTSLAPSPDPSQTDPLEGTTLGPAGRYKILQRIGEGGFGTVFMAEQTAPVRRRVAIKILKAGMDTRQVIARFEAERQALAMMDHPNIAKVLDGGETDHGRPYFVMELVRGTPLTTFCDREKLDTRQRLHLFLQVCRAVQHAHQKGIIHRDLKPANILVTVQEGAQPVPKVIDFGVAKAMEANLTDKTLFTRFEQMVGTPAYMSPEQAGTDAAANDIDTRADIYALGVLLYELLTGSTPFESATLQNAAFEEIRRILREEEAPRPSARLSSLEASRRQTLAESRNTPSPQSLDRQLRGDLDWIVMRAIEKDRTRRYETANAFALDLERFLSDEPVSAGPPTAAYRTRKFLRRHKAPLAAATTIAVLLIAGTAVSTWQAFRANEERDNAVAAEELANQRLAEAEAISTFLTTMIDRATPDDPATAEGTTTITTTVTFAEALKQAETRLAKDPSIPPERRAILQDAIEDFNRSLGLRDKITMQRNVVQFFTETYGPDSPKLGFALTDLATLLFNAGRNNEALPIRERILAQNLENWSKTGSTGNGFTVDLMRNLLFSYKHAGRTDDEFRILEQVVELERKLNGANSRTVKTWLQYRAARLEEEQRYDEAFTAYTEWLSLSRADRDAKVAPFGEAHWESIYANFDYATCLQIAQRHEEAIALFTESIALAKKEFGPQDGSVREASLRLAKSYRAVGRLAEADALYALYDRRSLVTSESPAVSAFLVKPPSEWRWLHPLDGGDPAEADPDFHLTFSEPEFDDSTWQKGSDSSGPTGGFGYGDDDFTGVDIGTPQSKELGKSAYFRHRFTTDHEYTNLELRCLCDDGLIVYIDGTEVARENVASREEAYRLPALWTIGGEEETAVFRLPLPGITLLPGEHVLAISVHNTETPSSDLRVGSISLVAVDTTEPSAKKGDKPATPPPSPSQP